MAANRFQPISAATLRGPDRILLYGVEGIGKTSWPTKADRPVFLDLENRCSHLSDSNGNPLQSITGPKCPNAMVKNWTDVLEMINNFPDGYGTFVLDTLDELETIMHTYLCSQFGAQHIDDIAGGFQKGYEVAVSTFRPFLMGLERLRNEKNMEIILLAHAGSENIKNPAAGDYFKFSPKVHKKLSSSIREWCDTILYASYQEDVHTKRLEAKKENNSILLKGKATGDGERIVHCNPLPAWYAKNHYDLPDEIELDYAKYDELRKAWIAKHAGGTSIKTIEKPKAEEKPKEEKKEVTQDELDLKALLNKMMDKTGEFKLSQKEVKEKFYPNGKSFISEFTQEEIKESIKKVDQYITAPW